MFANIKRTRKQHMVCSYCVHVRVFTAFYKKLVQLFTSTKPSHHDDERSRLDLLSRQFMFSCLFVVLCEHSNVRGSTERHGRCAHRHHGQLYVPYQVRLDDSSRRCHLQTSRPRRRLHQAKNRRNTQSISES